MKSDSLFRELGTDTTTAIRMFLTHAAAANGFPFEIKKRNVIDPYTAMTEEEILDKLKKSREHGRYRETDSAISDMRTKYGL